MAEEYDWNMDVKFIVKAKTLVEYGELIELVKTSIKNLKVAGRISSAEMKVSQKFKDRNWHWPNAQE